MTTAWLLAFSHVLTACLSGYLGYRLGPRVVESVEHHLEHPDNEEIVMTEPTSEAPVQTTELRTGVVIIIASIMVIIIGIMSGWFIIDSRHQHARDRHQAACTVQWGNDLLDAISDRQDVSKKLRSKERSYDMATAGRDQALNAIIDLVLRMSSGEQPPASLPQDPQEAFPVVLNQYAVASQALEEARTQLNSVRKELNNDVETNPYPVLDTDCILRNGS